MLTKTKGFSICKSPKIKERLKINFFTEFKYTKQANKKAMCLTLKENETK